MVQKLRQSLLDGSEVWKVSARPCPTYDECRVFGLRYGKEDVAINGSRDQFNATTEAPKPVGQVAVANHHHVGTFCSTLHLFGAKRLRQPHRIIHIQNERFAQEPFQRGPAAAETALQPSHVVSPTCRHTGQAGSEPQREKPEVEGINGREVADSGSFWSKGPQHVVDIVIYYRPEFANGDAIVGQRHNMLPNAKTARRGLQPRGQGSDAQCHRAFRAQMVMRPVCPMAAATTASG